MRLGAFCRLGGAAHGFPGKDALEDTAHNGGGFLVNHPLAFFLFGSYERQGVEQILTVHMGVAATQMERRGIATEKGGKSRLIREQNRLLKEVKRRITELGKWVKEKSAEKDTQSVNPFRSCPFPTAAHAP